MYTTRSFILIAAASLVALLGVAEVAVAAKKLSYDEAWKRCTSEISSVPGEQQVARASAGAGCMKKYGYRMKK